MKIPKVSVQDLYRHFLTDGGRIENKQYDKVRSCLSKVTYYSVTMAEQEAAKQTRITGKAFEVYKCRWDNHWHIGHKRNQIK